MYFLSIPTFLILYFLFIYLSKKIKLIDFPDDRKRHKGNIPLVGGLIIYFNIFLFSFYINTSEFFLVIFYTSAILLILGVIDDSRGLGVTFRLIAQLISSLIIVGYGLSINEIGDYGYGRNIELGFLSIIFTIFCVIGLTNSFNFIDGIDGLSAGLSLTSLFSIILFSYYSDTIQNFYDIEIFIIIILTTILFIIFNFSKNYKIFLGDSGSMTIGFLIAWFLILYTQNYKLFHPVLAIWCVSLPTFDLITVVVRRLLRKKNPFKPDRRHIHHILTDIGLNDKKVTFLILISSIFTNSIGIITLINFGPFISLVSYVCIFIIYVFINILLSREIKS